MEPDIVESPTGGSQDSPIEVVTPTPIGNDTRGFQSAPATPSTSFIDIKKHLECAKVEHRTAPPTPLASKTPWKSDLDTTLTTGDSFNTIKRKYKEKRTADLDPTPDGSPPQRYKETPIPPPQPRVYHSASDETPLAKRARRARPAWKPGTENTIPYDFIASNPVRPPAPGSTPDVCPPQRYKETPVPPPQPRLYNSASDATPAPKRPRTALPSWKPRTENTIPYSLLLPNPLHSANHAPPPAPAPRRKPDGPRRIVIPKEKTPPPPAPTNPFTPKSMRIRALERDLRLSRDEAELWRKGNEGAMEMWRTVHLEAEILRRKLEGLGGERAWQEVVWSGSAAAAGLVREGEVEAGASKMAFVVD